MKILVVGLGYVGLTTALWLAQQGHTVYGIDTPEVESKLKSGLHLTDEPKITNLVGDHLGKTFFLDPSHIDVDYVFSATYLKEDELASPAIYELVSGIRRRGINVDNLVLRSTLPPGEIHCIDKTMKTLGITKWCVNPEFLRQGHAYEDVAHPHRIVVGGPDRFFNDQILELYPGDVPKFNVSAESACMAKLVANSILAMKASVMLAVATHITGDKMNADASDIAAIVGSDPRIGNSHLGPSLGIGGACLPKDLALLSCELKYTPVNNFVGHISEFVNSYKGEMVLDNMGVDWAFVPRSTTVVVLGSGFKPGVTDNRGSVVDSIRVSRTNTAVLDPSTPETELKNTIEWLRDVSFVLVLNTKDVNFISEFARLPTLVKCFDPINISKSVEWKLMLGDIKTKIITLG